MSDNLNVLGKTEKYKTFFILIKRKLEILIKMVIKVLALYLTK